MRFCGVCGSEEASPGREQNQPPHHTPGPVRLPVCRRQLRRRRRPLLLSCGTLKQYSQSNKYTYIYTNIHAYTQTGAGAKVEQRTPKISVYISPHNGQRAHKKHTHTMHMYMNNPAHSRPDPFMMCIRACVHACVLSQWHYKFILFSPFARTRWQMRACSYLYSWI